MPVTDAIIEKIRKEGPISFYDFMEMALYHPGQGYYTSPGNKIGKMGDFYTSPYLSTVFGEMIAVQFEEMWRHLGRQPFTIVEQGAGSGLVCRDILRHLSNNFEMFSQLTYIIVEKSAFMRSLERKMLPEDAASKVSWFDTLPEVPPITGCIFSNELIDNFSIHQVVMEDKLMEIFIEYTEDHGLREILMPADHCLQDYLNEFRVTLPPGFRTEINLEALEWIQTVSEVLQKGFVLTIDYGYSAAELYSDHKKGGTLSCYRHHQVNDNPYVHIGEQDITTHVNFSALKEWGTRSGLEYCGYTNQTYFLRGLGLIDYMRRLENAHTMTDTSERQKWALVHTLLMEIGHKFKVLVQRKGTESALISGLQFPLRL